MVQATTLNVAFNSHNKSLLTIMMSNNVSMRFYFIFLRLYGYVNNSILDGRKFFFFLNCYLFWQDSHMAGQFLKLVMIKMTFVFSVSVC